MKGLLTLARAAGRLGVHPDWLRKLVRRGRLRAVDIGTPARPFYLLPEAEVRRYQREIQGRRGRPSKRGR
ncbi:MAG: helix-turn-helix domain-containing protein [Armatimonadetes bacterium]|nr:helix-turn-helix domain-containing protein [Armatimonadota bacterium]MDW8154812.1 helix-turn-helix domain-containing protein [Armatimonadota bacterium]